MTATVEVTLRSADRLDDFEERKILLGPLNNVSVGRSSKNANKNLLAAVHNAYINSPVVSRDHATFTTSTPAGDMSTPAVYITDNGSMHGTFVNSNKLSRGAAHRLSNGDFLRFGDNVIRDHDSFIAKRYHFSARRLPSSQPGPSFPRGISVPYASSDDEEDDVDSNGPPGSPYPASYGSQSNPVNLDDFEDGPTVYQFQVEDASNEYEPTPFPTAGEPLADKENEKPVTPKSEARTLPALSQVARLECAPTEDDESSSSDNEGDIPDYPDEEDADSVPASDAEAGLSDDEESGTDSDADVESDAGQADSRNPDGPDDIEKDMDAIRRIKLESMLEQQRQKPATPTPPQALQPPPAPSMYTPRPKLPEPYKFSQYSPTPFITQLPTSNKNAEQSKQPFSEPFVAWEYMLGASDPQQPASKPSPRTALDFSTPVMMREAPLPPRQPTYNESFLSYFPSNDYGRESLPALARAHAYVSPPYDEVNTSTVAPSKSDEAYTSQEVRNSSDATLDAASSLPHAVDEAAEAPITSTSRTKVSIAEIVEDAPQQQPTPISVSAPTNLKRKADVLDADDESANASASMIPTGAPKSIIPNTALDVPPSRPVKKSRSTFGLVASGMVAGFFVGGAAVLSALASLPETFFQ